MINAVMSCAYHNGDFSISISISIGMSIKGTKNQYLNLSTNK